MRPPPEPPPDTGSLEGDLTTLSEAQIARVAGTKLPWVAPRVLSEAMGDAEFHARVMEAFINPIRELLGKLVRRAIERGELAADTDVDHAIDLIHGVVIFRVLMSAGDLSRSFGEMTRISRDPARGVRALARHRLRAQVPEEPRGHPPQRRLAVRVAGVRRGHDRHGHTVPPAAQQRHLVVDLAVAVAPAALEVERPTPPAGRARCPSAASARSG